jgi:TRAP-type uncharacterized transport system substrate-binding protein
MSSPSKNIVEYFKSYIQHDLKRELASWLRLFRFYLPLTLLIFAVFVGIIVYLEPFATPKTYLAVGQEGGISPQMGRYFVSYFKDRNLSLELEKTRGLNSGLEQLKSENFKVNASFVTSGAASKEDYPNLVSLGSFVIAPLWLFYNGPTVDVDEPLLFFKDRKINIGSKNTITNKIFMNLSELTGQYDDNHQHLFTFEHLDAAEALREKRIDAMFIVDGFESPLIQSLLKDPDIKIMSFALADAYTKKYPFLKKVIVPKASLNIHTLRPEKDITLLASSINLLVEKNVEPAVQWAFLMAAKEFQFKSERFFSSDPMPSYVDKSFPLSSVAERYYDSGIPGIFDYVPLRYGSSIQHVWVFVLAGYLVFLPLIRRIARLRSEASQKLLWQHFLELRYLDDRSSAATDKESRQEILRNLNELELRVSRTWVSAKDLNNYYNLKRSVANAIRDVESKITAR